MQIEPYKRNDILQKRSIFLRSLLTVATPYLINDDNEVCYIHLTRISHVPDIITHMGHDSLSQISYRATWLTTHSRMSHITHMNTLCHTRIRRAYRSLLQKSPIKETIFCKWDLYSGTHKYVVPHRATWRSAHRRMSHVTHMNLSCHTGQRDSSQVIHYVALQMKSSVSSLAMSYVATCVSLRCPADETERALPPMCKGLTNELLNERGSYHAKVNERGSYHTKVT